MTAEKEKRHDDYSQDENVERHVRKSRWISVDIGGKPYVFFIPNNNNIKCCFFFPFEFECHTRECCLPKLLHCFYYSLARESFCPQTRSKIRLKWKLNVHVIDCAQKESGFFVWTRLIRRRHIVVVVKNR